MKRIKVRLVGTGLEHDPIRANLPTYRVDCKRDAEGQPIRDEEGRTFFDIDLEKRVAWVLVPDDEVGPDGRLDEERIRKKYGGRYSTFKREEVEAPEE